eukprot:9503140-Pyramimonas_sp.AAC.1
MSGVRLTPPPPDSRVTFPNSLSVIPVSHPLAPNAAMDSPADAQPSKANFQMVVGQKAEDEETLPGTVMTKWTGQMKTGPA